MSIDWTYSSQSDTSRIFDFEDGDVQHGQKKKPTNFESINLTWVWVYERGARGSLVDTIVSNAFFREFLFIRFYLTVSATERERQRHIIHLWVIFFFNRIRFNTAYVYFHQFFFLYINICFDRNEQRMWLTVLRRRRLCVSHTSSCMREPKLNIKMRYFFFICVVNSQHRCRAIFILLISCFYFYYRSVHSRLFYSHFFVLLVPYFACFGFHCAVRTLYACGANNNSVSELSFIGILTRT